MLVIKSDNILLGKELEIFKGYLQINGNKIFSITRSKPQGTRFIDATDYIICPGFINSHTHVGDSAFKDLGIGLRIDKIVKPPLGLKHRLLRETDRETLVTNMANSIMHMLSTGTTTFVDFREGGTEGIEVLKSALHKAPLIRPVILGRPAHENAADLLKHCNGLGLPSAGYYTEKQLNLLSKLTYAEKKVMAMHVCETKSGELRKALLAKPDFIVHMTNADNAELSIVRSFNLPVVCCPRANSILRIGFPPVEKLQYVALGTDNVMLNSPNLIREIEFTYKSLKRRSLTPKDVLKMITTNPGQMLKMGNGIIGKNKLADLVLIDSKASNMAPVSDPVASIVLRAEPENIHKVFINGRLVFERKCV